MFRIVGGFHIIFRTVAALAVSIGVIAALPAAADPIPFTEESVLRGIDYPTAPTDAFGYGLAFADLDGDGDPDVVTVGRGNGVVGVYENDGTGHFTDHSATSGIPTISRPSGVVAGDYDGDGDLDLYFSNWLIADLLMRNDGNFAFTDVTAATGLGDIGAGSGCAWGDYDGDGRIDLYLSNRTGTEDGLYTSLEPNRLYRNQPDGTFMDVLDLAGMSSGERLTFQAVFFDYDRDGDADLYVSNDKCSGRNNNQLWRNTNGNFNDVTEVSNTGVCMNSMGVAVGDFDGNGYQDLYPTNTPEGNPLLLNLGDGTFSDATGTSGTGSYAIGWGAIFLDYDNDTHQELYVCNMAAPNRLYDHDGLWPCLDVAADTACADPGYSFGNATADIDGDGDLDLLVSNAPGAVRLYVNHEGETRGWVKFRVVGSGHNTFGIGTNVELRLGNVWQLREVVQGGNNFKSHNDLTVHFGVDDVLIADALLVTWPGGATRSMLQVPTNQTWSLYPPSALGDGDFDGDSDVDDFYAFLDCAPGPTGSDLTPGCEMMDFDGDWTVDDRDLLFFSQQYVDGVTDCNGNGIADLVDIFAGASSDVDQDGQPDECAAFPAAGSVPAGGGGLLVARDGGGGVTLDWTASCLAGDDDYAVYRGQLGEFSGHQPATCSTAGATSWNLGPGGSAEYYLIVPRNANREGSYGRDGSGAERPASTAACLERLIGSCE